MCGVSRRSQSRSQSIGFEDGNTLKFFRRPRVNPLRHPRRPPLRSKNSLGGQKATVASWILCSINGKWKRDAEYKLPIKHARCSFPFSVFQGLWNIRRPFSEATMWTTWGRDLPCSYAYGAALSLHSCQKRYKVYTVGSKLWICISVLINASRKHSWNCIF